MRQVALFALVAFPCLVVSQEKSAPRPRDAEKNSTQSDKRKNNGGRQQTPSKAQPLTNPTTSPPGDPNSVKPTPADKQQPTVNIGAVPPLSVKPVKDWTDAGQWVFSFGLVIVGTLQAILLFKTWRATKENAEAARNNVRAARANFKASASSARAGIKNAEAAVANSAAANQQVELMKRQIAVMEGSLKATTESSEAARKSADAATRSADAFMKGERAWILISNIRGIPPSPIPQREMVHIIPVFMNYGRTVAVITQCWYNWRVLPVPDDLPTDPDYTDEHGTTTSKDIRVALPPNSIFEPLSRRSVGNNSLTSIYPNDSRPNASRLWVYGLINYLDVFECPHETRFSFVYLPVLSANMSPFESDFYMAGPDPYNRST